MRSCPLQTPRRDPRQRMLSSLGARSRRGPIRGLRIVLEAAELRPISRIAQTALTLGCTLGT